MDVKNNNNNINNKENENNDFKSIKNKLINTELKPKNTIKKS